MSPELLVLRYTAFATVATIANLATQRLVLFFGDDKALFTLAVALGTMVGLVIKYILDKRWVFGDAETGLRNHSRKFSLYTAMGVVTTAIFWISETAAWFTWRTDMMREIGALFGLAIGYIVKYNLDNRFVFTRAATGKAE